MSPEELAVSPSATAGLAVRPRRRRRWWRWALAAVLALVVLVFVSAAVAVSASDEPPLGLPATAPAAPIGILDGTWQVAPGSTAGFRIRQTVLGLSGDVVGRTTAVSGSAVVSAGSVTSARFTVDLTRVVAGGKPSPQFEISLDTKAHPLATIALAGPVLLGSPFDSGGTQTATARADLTLRGVTRSVTLRVTGRRDGADIQIAGSIPVAFTDWGIVGPTGYGVLGSLANDGVAEFSLVLRHA